MDVKLETITVNTASDASTVLDIVCKNTGKIYEEFELDLGYYFSTPHLVMDTIHKISQEEMGLITDVDQHSFVGSSMLGTIFFAEAVFWKLI